MMNIESKEEVVQNLKDAGCGTETIQDFLTGLIRCILQITDSVVFICWLQRQTKVRMLWTGRLQDLTVGYPD